MKKKLSFIEILNIPEAKALVERIEELAGEKDPSLIRIRQSYIEELEKKYGYTY